MATLVATLKVLSRFPSPTAYSAWYNACCRLRMCGSTNIIDQDIDQKMQRTQNRALVKKTVSVPIALILFSQYWA